MTETIQQVTCTLVDGYAHIQLNRPEKYNAIIGSMAKAFQAYLDQAAEDESVRAVLISGSGKAFCAGQDLKEFTEGGDTDASAIVEQYYNPIVHKIMELEKPVICAVQGVAAGAGANLALACDIVIAAESAKFIQAFSKIGLIPDTGGTYILPRLVGLARAKALMMLGEPVVATDAVQMGMIYKTVPDDQLVDQMTSLAKQVATLPTRALALTKKALHRSLDSDADKQLGIEAHLQAMAIQTEDFSEGVAAFLEKRAPDFSGR